MRFLLDENLPGDLAAAFRLMRFETSHVRERYPERTPDAQVVALARELDAVVLTRDSTFHEQELVAQSLKQGGVTIITVTLPRDYESFEAIRDVLWMMLEEVDRIPIHEGSHIRCTVRAPRGQKRRRGRPILTYTVPQRRSIKG